MLLSNLIEVEVEVWQRPKNNFQNRFLKVILQKTCNTHNHEYLEKLLLLLNYKCKTQFQCLPLALFSVDTPLFV
jgi:hypothetical protein